MSMFLIWATLVHLQVFSLLLSLVFLAACFNYSEDGDKPERVAYCSLLFLFFMTIAIIGG